MKATRHTDGTIDLDGTPEEIARILAMSAPSTPAAPEPIRATPPHQPEPATKPTKRQPPPTPPPGSQPGTLPYNILAIMRQKPGTPFSAADLVAALADGTGMNQVSGTLSRMTIRHGILRQVGRGKYTMSPAQ